MFAGFYSNVARTGRKMVENGLGSFYLSAHSPVLFPQIAGVCSAAPVIHFVWNCVGRGRVGYLLAGSLWLFSRYGLPPWG